MSELPRAAIATAYDAIAADYDRLVSDDAWIRRQIWRTYADAFLPGEVVLDLSCGTGTDSVFLAGRGVRVVAADISLGMLAQLRRKVARAGVASLVHPCVHDTAELAAWRPAAFDGIVSAFAGVSTVADLHRFATTAAALLRPGGAMLLHLLARFSLWEWMGLVAHRRWGEAARLRFQRERTFIVGGRRLRHFMHLPREVYAAAFADRFTLRRAYSLGALRPPSTARRVPAAVASGLGRLEALVRARRPFLDWGRSFVLDLQRRRDAVGGAAGG